MRRAEHRLIANGLLCRLALVVPLMASVSAAEEEDGKNLQTVQQRLTIASHMIQRMQGESKAVFGAELEGLQTRFLERVDKQLVEDSNAFFERVMSTYRQHKAAAKPADSDMHRRRYEEKRKEVEAFHQAYADLVKERGDAARKVLDEEKYAARVARARQLAAENQYEEAYSLADGANHQMIVALATLRDQETIEYRLEFGSPAEEYEYEIRRFESQKMLLEMMVAEKKPQEGSLAMIETFVAQADSKSKAARGLADAGQFEQAVEQQEEAVEELTKAMRVAGVYF